MSHLKKLFYSDINHYKSTREMQRFRDHFFHLKIKEAEADILKRIFSSLFPYKPRLVQLAAGTTGRLGDKPTSSGTKIQSGSDVGV